MAEIKRMTKSQRSKIKIMHAAKGLYEEHGIENVTFNQIAEAADVCRSTVFNHFASSRELMLAIYEQEIADINEHCKRAGLSGEALIREMFAKLIEDTAFYPALTLQLLSSALISGEESKAIRDIENLISENLVDRKDHRSTLPASGVDERVIAIMGWYYGLVNHYHARGLKFDAKELNKYFDGLLDAIFNM